MSSGFTRGVELVAKQTLFAEGCRGSCSTEVIDKFDLQKGKNVQTYGLGIKEVWQVPEENLKPGLIQHSLGWPLHSSPFSDVYGGTFLYHSQPNTIQLGNWLSHPPVLTPLLRNGGWVGLQKPLLESLQRIPKMEAPS
jgi:flavin-dependent dehydrogenase